MDGLIQIYIATTLNLTLCTAIPHCRVNTFKITSRVTIRWFKAKTPPCDTNMAHVTSWERQEILHCVNFIRFPVYPTHPVAIPHCRVNTFKVTNRVTIPWLKAKTHNMCVEIITSVTIFQHIFIIECHWIVQFCLSNSYVCAFRGWAERKTKTKGCYLCRSQAGPTLIFS